MSAPVAPVAPVWMSLLASPEPAVERVNPEEAGRFDELLTEVFGGRGTASRSLTSHLTGQEKATQKAEEGQGLESTPLAALGPFVDGSGPDALASVSQMMGLGFEGSLSDTPLPPPRPALRVVPSWVEPDSAAPSASVDGEALVSVVPLATSMQGSDLSADLELLGFESPLTVMDLPVQKEPTGLHLVPNSTQSSTAASEPLIPPAPKFHLHKAKPHSPIQGIASVAIPQSARPSQAPTTVRASSTPFSNLASNLSHLDSTESNSPQTPASQSVPTPASESAKAPLDATPADLDVEAWVPEDRPLNEPALPTVDGASAEGDPGSFQVVSAARPSGGYGGFRSGHHTAAASMPPPREWAEAVHVDGEVGTVSVQIDDEVAVGVHVDAERVRVVVDTTADAAQSLAGLQAELQQELADSGRAFDYEQRSEDEAASSKVSGDSDEPVATAASVVARGRLVNRIA